MSAQNNNEPLKKKKLKHFPSFYPFAFALGRLLSLRLPSAPLRTGSFWQAWGFILETWGFPPKADPPPAEGLVAWNLGLGALFSLAIALGFPALSWAQDLSNLRKTAIVVNSDTLSLDTLSIIPGSLFLLHEDGTPVDSSYYTIDYSRSRLIWKPDAFIQNKSLGVSYRVFPYFFSKEHRHKAMEDILTGQSESANPFIYTYDNKKNDFFGLEGLNKSGSIARGISFGNNQDVIVNSSLDLRLSGKLNEKVSILAAITDDNVPIQPGGNTQQIQEFDKVFIQLFNENTKLIAGDFELQKPSKSYFMNYYKKAQGVSFQTKQARPNTENPGIWDVSTAAAISKGKYARKKFIGTEGNQGPYKLTGNENELFIIVLSGTEKVYIDGELLQRGEDNDYIIDYNTAEVTFTPKRLVTKDKRIEVEFQYSDKNYSRSLWFAGTDFTKNNFILNVGIYSEQDAKNQPIDQDLTDSQKQFLNDLGDNLDSAYTPIIDSVGYSDLGVRYKKKDTLGYAIYEYSADSGLFTVAFSQLGQGNGSYIQDVNTVANGRVFKWVPPDTVSGNLVLNGSYEPVVLMISPKKKQMLTLGGAYRFSKNTIGSFETAISNNDLNTFSSKDDNDNAGIAYKMNFQHTLALSKSEVNPWQLKSTLGYEQVEKRFTPVERFRPVEFDRDWNLSGNPPMADNEYIPSVSLEILKKDFGSVQYGFKSFIKGDQYSGYNNSASVNINKNGFQSIFNGSLLKSSSSLSKSTFIRSKGVWSKTIKWLVVGVGEEQEKNIINYGSSDSLMMNSYEFYDWNLFMRSVDTAKNRVGVSYGQRTDLNPVNNGLKESTVAENVKLTLDLMKRPNSVLSGNITYRKLTIKDTLLTSNKPDESLISRVEYRLVLLKGSVTSSTFYEIGSGMEVKKEFSYIKVAEGQGVYEWIDRDSNKIETLDEFEIAAFQYKANYIKVYTPTNAYIKTFSNMFNEVLYIRPAAFWKHEEGIKKFLTRFSNQTAYRVDRKNTSRGPDKAYNPFRSETGDSTLVTLNSSFRNILSFNKNDSRFGVDLKYQEIRNKSLLINGFDSRKQLLKSAYIRWNLSKQYTLNFLSASGSKTSASELLSSKDYQIEYSEFEPGLAFQPNSKFRLSIYYNYKDKENRLMKLVLDTLGDTLSFSGGERALHNKVGAEMKQNSVAKGSLLLKVDYINISYKKQDGSDGSQNTSVGFEMLEGLQTGSNFTWSCSYQRNLSGHMQLSVTYDGRKSEETPAAHRGSVQIRAFF